MTSVNLAERYACFLSSPVSYQTLLNVNSSHTPLTSDLCTKRYRMYGATQATSFRFASVDARSTLPGTSTRPFGISENLMRRASCGLMLSALIKGTSRSGVTKSHSWTRYSLAQPRWFAGWRLVTTTASVLRRASPSAFMKHFHLHGAMTRVGPISATTLHRAPASWTNAFASSRRRYSTRKRPIFSIRHQENLT